MSIKKNNLKINPDEIEQKKQRLLTCIGATEVTLGLPPKKHTGWDRFKLYINLIYVLFLLQIVALRLIFRRGRK